MTLEWDERDYLIAGVLGSFMVILFALVIILFALFNRVNKKLKMLQQTETPVVHQPPTQQDYLANRGFQEYRGPQPAYGGPTTPGGPSGYHSTHGGSTYGQQISAAPQGRAPQGRNWGQIASTAADTTSAVNNASETFNNFSGRF